MQPLLSFILGTAIGSFCNVVIYRLHAGDSPARGRSYCPRCKHALTSADLVPLVSFFALRGKCRYCRKPISWQYPLVEAAMGIIALLTVVRFGVTPVSLVGIVLGAFLLVMFVYDLKYQLILDRVSVPAMVAALLFSLLLHRPFLSILLGAILGAGLFLAQYVLSKGRWIGGGDIRLGGVLGLALGWPLTAVALVIAYLTGAAAAVALLVSRKRKWSSMIPFGTFLSLAAFITMLWGEGILYWYQHGGFFDWVVMTLLKYYNP